MADHYFSIKPIDAIQRTVKSVVVDTSTTAGSKIELRITDGGSTAKEIYDALEWLADLFATPDRRVVPSGLLKR